MSRPESEKIDIKCPSCNRIVKTPQSMLGKTVPCPGCRSDLHLVLQEEISDWIQPATPLFDPIATAAPAPEFPPLPSPIPQAAQYADAQLPRDSLRRKRFDTGGDMATDFPDVKFSTYWSIPLVSGAWVVALFLVAASILLPPLMYMVHYFIDRKPAAIGPLLWPYFGLVVSTMLGALVYRVILEMVVVLFRISKTLDRIERQQ